MVPNIVFNNQVEYYVSKFFSQQDGEPIDDDTIGKECNKTLAILAEQFLLFDKVALKIGRQNFELFFLIRELGFEKVEKLITHGILIPVLWTPAVFTSKGTTNPDGTSNESSVMGQSPIFPGNFMDEGADPEKNVKQLFNYLLYPKHEQKRFIKVLSDKYVIPDTSIAKHSADIVLDAYKTNRLSSFGFDGTRDPNYLGFDARFKLFLLGNEVLESSVLAQNNYKSYGNYNMFHLTKISIDHIESALKVSSNTSEILSLEGIADIRTLVLSNLLSLEKVLDIRYQNEVKLYRKWINTISENTDAKLITKEYLEKVVGKTNFFNSNKGKFLKTMSLFTIGTGVSYALQALPLASVAALGLSMLDTFYLEPILKGWSPKRFVEKIEHQIER